MPAYSKSWPTWLQRLMLQRYIPIRSEATLRAWRLPFGVGWTRFTFDASASLVVYFSWVGLEPNLFPCNKDSIWASCNKIQVWLNFDYVIDVLWVPAWSWDGTDTEIWPILGQVATENTGGFNLRNRVKLSTVGGGGGLLAVLFWFWIRSCISAFCCWSSWVSSGGKPVSRLGGIWCFGVDEKLE